MYDYSYNPSTISGYSSALEATSVLATLGAFVGIILIMGLVIGVLQIIGMWKMFTKAGEKGWKSIKLPQLLLKNHPFSNIPKL